MDGKPAKPNFDNGGIPNFLAAELRRLVEHRGGVSDARTAPPRLSPSFSFRMEDLPEVKPSASLGRVIQEYFWSSSQCSHTI